MPIFDGNLPYTNLHSMNLDWIIETVSQIKKEWDEFGYSVTANAIEGEYPNVVVTGDLINGLNFRFTLVRGEKGDKGEKGDDGIGIDSCGLTDQGYLVIRYSDGSYFISSGTLKGPQGPPGEGLRILDVYPTLQDLQTAHPTGSPSAMYLVGVDPDFQLYVWSSSSNQWVLGGSLTTPPASTTAPLMDGTASAGVSNRYARADHVHPSDNTKASLEDVYPIGSIYMNANIGTNPATLLGFGTWTQLKDTFLLACGDSHDKGETGGEENSTLTVRNLPKQTGYIQVHGGGGSQAGTVISTVGGDVFSVANPIANAYRQGTRYTGAGSSGDIIYDNHGNNESFTNMPPYIAVYVWVRTA